MSAVAAYSGRMVNRSLRQGESIFRLFGPESMTHNVKIGKSYPGGAWWGLGSAPKSAKEWRERAAVLDEFNRDGYVVVGQIGEKSGPKAVVGTVSEQRGKDLPQYLPGGATQAFFFLDKSTFKVMPTGWKDANGI
ncbi:hypothetical protein MKD38_12600 [Cupriavidus sp. WGlv3]|uniref:hypothetical protein n=1 Tax=Cupriavidus sp. WGlv3 TaxID=2919924 RepID=UPI0020916BED|nr:hypothetical protein [Cupriavidus sp. WGlv3]MCO4862518.1 hypothetical protein [Cupriavidus sp. WGlv3]